MLRKKHKTKYDWSAVNEYFNTGHTLKECKDKFGFDSNALYAARQVGNCTIPVQGSRSYVPFEELFCRGKRVAIPTLKTRILRDKIFRYRCAKCAISDWQGAPIVLHLDHIDGDRMNNTIDNLRFLCPNCHSQTPTYCVGLRDRKEGGRKSAKDYLLEAIAQ